MIHLLTPRYYALRNRLTRLAPGDGLKTLMLALLGLGFWAFMFSISFRVLSYFRTIEGLGDLLALRLLSMILLTFFSILVFSNIVTSLSTFYLSGELDILLSAPVRIEDVFRAKFVETIIDSSWMTLIYGLPVFIAYGAVFKASAWYYLGLMGTLVPFLIIPASIGIIITMLLVNAFPARRAKDVLVLLGLLFFVAIYILFRMLRPERLVDPDTFPTLVQYLTAMRGPVTPLLPTYFADRAGKQASICSCSGALPAQGSLSGNGSAAGSITPAGPVRRRENGRTSHAPRLPTPFSIFSPGPSRERCAPSY
jgi:ABC-2 type transport system permease protein